MSIFDPIVSMEAVNRDALQSELRRAGNPDLHQWDDAERFYHAVRQANRPISQRSPTLRFLRRFFRMG